MPRKVYPNATAVAPTSTEVGFPKPTVTRNGQVEVLTVWKKSLLFNCNGFTVFDTKGNLTFRVDNYLMGNKSEIVLMDASGKSLLTIRRKKLSLGDNWMVYNGDETTAPIFTVKKHVNFLNSKVLAQVTTGVSGSSKSRPVYTIEGSYTQRCCVVYDVNRNRVAEIKRKEEVAGVSFGLDVFRLVVQPELDPTVAMSLVILLDQMFRSRAKSA